MNTKRAFTLVEILTVIVIISILVTLVTLAVAGAMRSAKRAKIGWEMNQFVMALEQYKNEFGEYPPDFFDDAALIRHVKKRWPRFKFSPHDPSNPNYPPELQYYANSIRQAIGNVYRNQNVYTSAMRSGWLGSPTARVHFASGVHSSKLASLCVWLGGFPDREGNFCGFGADPEAPFGRKTSNNEVNCGYGGMNMGTWDDVAVGTLDKKNFIELTINKNVFFAGTSDTLVPCIVSKISSDTVVPVIYFRGTSDGGADAYFYTETSGQTIVKQFDFASMFASGVRGLPDVSHWRDCGVVVPYLRSDKRSTGGTLVWMEPTKYQLIHPGVDCKFGERNKDMLRIIDSGAAIGQYDLDNLPNFSEGKELKSILP